MVGNDSNVDLLQLVTCLTGTTEVANILSRHPEWDRGMHRLRLPAILRDSSPVPHNEDHLTPSSWKGDVSLQSVSLQTSWRRGKAMAMEETPEVGPMMALLEETPSIDILRPLGTLVLTQPRCADDNEDNDNEDEGMQTQDQSCTKQILSGVMSTPCSRELEDAIAAEDGAAAGAVSSDIIFDGQKVNKAHALAIRSQHRHAPASTDRLRRVQEIGRFESRSDTVIDFESPFGGCQNLMLNEPIVALIQCDKRIFLGFGDVIDICVNSESTDQVSLDLLMEDTVSVTFQVVDLFLATENNDPSLKNDWHTSSHLQPAWLTSPGRLVHVINPIIRIPAEGKPYYLLESSVLLAFAATLMARLKTGDLKRIPSVARSRHFPYREKSGATK